MTTRARAIHLKHQNLHLLCKADKIDLNRLALNRLSKIRLFSSSQNGPAATFCQPGICCPIYKHHFTRSTHPDSSLRFRAGGQRVKKFSFSRICVSARDFFCRPAADSILMPPTFPIASLNRYTPNFSGVPQKLAWCQQFGLQIFPKLGDAHNCPQKNRCF